jgi:hypothetical protein
MKPMQRVILAAFLLLPLCGCATMDCATTMDALWGWFSDSDEEAEAADQIEQEQYIKDNRSGAWKPTVSPY